MRTFTDEEIFQEMEKQDALGTPTPDYPIPEKVETLKAQLDWLCRGRRAAVYFPQGSVVLPPPEGMSELKTPKGIFIYNPNLINASEVLAAINTNQIGEILGYGIAAKPKLSETIGAVVIRSEDGLEKQAVVVDSKHLTRVFFASLKISDDGDTVQLESTDNVIQQREK